MKLQLYYILVSPLSQEISITSKEKYEKVQITMANIYLRFIRNTLLGLDETVKKLWEIIDSPRTEAKEKIKAITLLKGCYNKRLDLIKSEPGLIQQKKLMDDVKLLSELKNT